MSVDPYKDVGAVVPKRAIPPWVKYIIAAWMARELMRGPLSSAAQKALRKKERHYAKHGPREFMRELVT